MNLSDYYQTKYKLELHVGLSRQQPETEADLKMWFICLYRHFIKIKFIHIATSFTIV